MSCTACERRIEDGLARLPGVARVRANSARGTVRVVFESGEDATRVRENEGRRANPQDATQGDMVRNALPATALADDVRGVSPADVHAFASAAAPDPIPAALAALHYPVIAARDARRLRTRQWLTAAAVVLVLVAAYLLLDHAGVFLRFPTADAVTPLPVLFVIGLLTSVHCIAMCGGINLSQSASAQPTRSPRALTPTLLYNLGRVASYTIVGGIVGALGAVVTPSGRWRGVVMLAAAAFMLLMGLGQLGLFPSPSRIAPRLPRGVARFVDRGRQRRGPFLVGLLNGLMPCGPLQSMQLYALSTGGWALGALSMFLFSAGTVPLMFAFGALASLARGRFSGVMRVASAALVLLLGAMMLNNGLSLCGLPTLW